MNEFFAGVPNVILIIGGTVLLMWLLFFMDSIFSGNLKKKYAVYPLRQPHDGAANGIISFFTAPFFHGDFTHLIGNTLPFMISAWFVLLAGERNFFVVTPVVMIVMGLGIKLFSERSVIGMSGVIIGYFSYAVSIGLFTKNIALVVFGGILFILAVLFYEAPGIDQGSGILWMIYPRNPPDLPPDVAPTSTTAHFFGFVGGLVAACVMSLIYANQFNL